VSHKGSRFSVFNHAKSLSIRKPLIVTDEYYHSVGGSKDIEDCFSNAGMDYALFYDISGEPTLKDVEGAITTFRDHECDGVVCIGGGSAIDAAKALAVMVTNPGTIADYMGYHKVVNPRVPLIAIPTTSGTGSEVTRVVVITDTEKNVKMMCLDNAFMPDVAIIDYKLTLTMPKTLTAFVGMDALTHATEAYVSKKANIVSDMFALRATAMIIKNIMNAYSFPDDEDARENMMVGSSFAGIAFSNSSVCAVHGLSRPIGAYFNVPHGLSNAMFLPIVTERSIGEKTNRYADIARFIGHDGDLSDEDLAALIVEDLKRLNEGLTIPNLKEYGVNREEYEKAIPDMVKAAIASGSPANNPMLFSSEEMAEIYRVAYDY
jgi:alcohol dehydrogenase